MSVRSSRAHLILGSSITSLRELHDRDPPVSSWIYLLFTAENKAEKLQPKLLSLTAAPVSCPHTLLGLRAEGLGFRLWEGKATGHSGNNFLWHSFSLPVLSLLPALVLCLLPFALLVFPSRLLALMSLVQISLSLQIIWNSRKLESTTAQGTQLDGETAING